MSTFLFTDIEGSTEKWEKYKNEMGEALSRHDAILNENINKFGGKIIKHTGDGIFAVFENDEPLRCAIEIQKNISKENWGKIGELRIRIGLHAGIAEKREKDYFGPAINKTARVMAIAWGGQIILTPEVKNASQLPPNATLKDLGFHLLKDLCEPQLIYELTYPEQRIKEFPPLRSLSVHPHNLPIQTTPFFGRKRELAEIIKLIENPSCRLISLVGTGGIGKTRLAIQVAAEKIEHFKNGVYFVPLNPLSSAEFLVSTIADALNFSFYSKEDEKVQILNYLREKDMLIILDNFEHLIQGVSIIGDLLSSAPKVKILVTSRELLNLSGEWIVQVQGMEIPQGEKIDVGGFSAVQLFLHNARRVKSDISISGEETNYVVRICQLVSGVPLGIEIASSWLKSLSCKEIAQEIEKNIDFLSTSLRDLPERHRSLRAVFDYSWNLLSEDEKDIFMKISVFQGGFTRDAAMKVTGVSLPTLSVLIDKSLLRRNSSGRYEMLEIIRQYAEEKIARVEEQIKHMKDSHCAYYAELLNQKEKDIREELQSEVIETLREESKNIKAAWMWAVQQGKKTEIDKSTVSLSSFYALENRFREGEKIFKEAAEKLEKLPEENSEQIIYGKVIARYGSFSYYLGFYDKARELLEKSLLIFRKFDVRSEISFALSALGNINIQLGDYEEAKQYQQESLNLDKSEQDKVGISGGLNAIGVIHYHLQEYGEARKYFEEDLSMSKKMGFRKGIATAYGNLGLVAHGEGNFEKAKTLLEKGLLIDREMNNKLGIANSLHNLGLVSKGLKDYKKAKEYYEEALEIRKELGDRMGIAISFNNLGNLGGYTVSLEESLKYHREAMAIRKEMGDKMGVAQSLLNLAETFSKKEEDKEAKEYFREALMAAVDSKEKFIIQESLLGIAEHLLKDKSEKRSFEILSFLHNLKETDDDFKARAKSVFEDVKSKLPVETVSEVETKVKDKKLKDVVSEIISQLVDEDL